MSGSPNVGKSLLFNRLTGVYVTVSNYPGTTVDVSRGKVVEFECPLSQKMKEDVSREKGFKVTDAEVRMRGYCPKCRQERK